MSASAAGPHVPATVRGQQKVLALLVVGGVALLLLVLGLGFAIYYAFAPSAAGLSGPVGPVGHVVGAAQRGAGLARTRRDDLAAVPMRAGSAADAQPSALSTRDPGSIVLPPGATAGPAGVPAGFTHTPAGALAQLAGIDQTALDSASLRGARTVINSWAAPGGPTAQTWSGVRAMVDFLSAVGPSAGKTPGVALSATAMMGLVKATDGPDWVLACVDFEVDATVVRTARVALADCERMAWQGDRWVIGPGAEPASAPSMWPGTDAAIEAGYKELRGK